MSSNPSTNNSPSDREIARLMLEWVKAENANDSERARKLQLEINLIRQSCPDCTI
ncbi:hypothetical protein S-MbCM7_054 [Synechococcus phage ACG-2014h]|uniref:Uncharacterized protein n=1 Tax=Synechococcus phage ACG-2014h TaxID=1340810 RepID=V5US52_9CAUD|nr:hypothetical protein S-MbCM7_054 [Synechococcus phage ACG-2014h]AHB80468.1 hypothetical protein S-MbCM7_054 [Synechococcus phage ACG-2014h]